MTEQVKHDFANFSYYLQKAATAFPRLTRATIMVQAYQNATRSKELDVVVMHNLFHKQLRVEFNRLSEEELALYETTVVLFYSICLQLDALMPAEDSSNRLC